MGLLTAEQIKSAQDRPFKDVECPEWGGTVRVRAITGADRDAFEAENNPDGKCFVRTNFRSRLLVKSIVGADGERIYTDADAASLGLKAGAVLDRVFDAALELSKMRKEDLEGDAKNSGTGQSAGSFSDSASNSESLTPTTCLAH